MRRTAKVLLYKALINQLARSFAHPVQIVRKGPSIELMNNAIFHRIGVDVPTEAT